MAKTTVAEAAALEADAERYPEERSEILLEAAAAWRRAGRVDRARELLAELIETGGEDGCFARMEVAEIHFNEGAAEAAYAELAVLARDPALHDGHCLLVGELLAEREDLKGALAWFDRAVVRLSQDEIDALSEPDAWYAHAASIVRQRRDVRQRLGLPPDATDELAPERPSDQPVDLGEVEDDLTARVVPGLLRLLVFQRTERAEARRRWPEAYSDSDDDYYVGTERAWRELADSGIPAIRVAAATVSGLVAYAEQRGVSPIDEVTKARYAESFDERDLIAWPPARNGPCWCGSGGKYKKCCGRILAQ